jgi:hypothetical protein
MHHIGKPAFYEDVKRKLDSLHQLGYVVFYEKIVHTPGTDSATKDSLNRKYRKIMGSLYSAGYLNSAEGTILGKKYSFAKQLVNQPFGATIGIDTNRDRRVDAFIGDLIASFERNFFLVQLTPCDFSTPLKEKYECEKIKNKEARNYFTKHYRNKYIADEINKAPNNKIVLLYGEYHYEGILDSLKNINQLWRAL